MKLRSAVVLAALGVAVVACSSSETDEPVAAAKSSERVQIDASSQSRAKLGVVHWGVDRGTAGASAVRGYDADGNAIVTLDSATSTTFATEEDASAYPHVFVARLRLGDRSFSLKVEARETDHRTVDNDFTGDAGEALALIAADLRSGKPSSSLATASTHLRTADLVDGQPQCLVTCDPAVLTSAGANAGAASACAGGDPACGPGVNQAAGAQSTAGAQCACPGDNTCSESVNVQGGPVVGHAQQFVNDACCSVKSSDGSAGACGATTRADHKPTGPRAVDMPVSPGGYGQVPGSTDFGNRLAAFALANMAKYRIEYVIWNGEYDDGHGKVPDVGNGSPTADHRDHVHVSFLP